MKAIRILIIISAFSVLILGRAYGQGIDSTRRVSGRYYRKVLQTDSLTAARVDSIQVSYKTGLKQIIGNSSLTDGARRKAIDSLVNEKNRRLEELLPEGRRNKLIPPDERRRTWKRDTTAKTNG